MILKGNHESTSPGPAWMACVGGQRVVIHEDLHHFWKAEKKEKGREEKRERGEGERSSGEG